MYTDRPYAFTGTHHGMTEAQQEAVRHLLSILQPTVLHNGCCEGSDRRVAALCRIKGILMAYHPSSQEQHAWAHTFQHRQEQVYSTRAPLTRNRVMVKLGSRGLIATPHQVGEILRSGTWATIREARKLHRPIWIVYPHGELHVE